MQNIIFNILITCCCLLVPSCTKDGDTPKPPSATPAKSCDCSSLLIGYLEMEDCQVYLPGNQPFSCVGNELLEISWNVGMHRAIFRSTVHSFCKSPVQLWVYDGEPSPSADWSCSATIVFAQLDFDGHELCLELDDAFLTCAFEKEDGFWFALAVE